MLTPSNVSSCNIDCHVSACRDMPRVDIDKLELPDNHPFAVKKKVSLRVRLCTCFDLFMHMLGQHHIAAVLIDSV